MIGRRASRRCLSALSGLAATVAATAPLLSLSPAASAADMAAGQVARIEWSRFSAGVPADGDAQRSRAILANAASYALTSWWIAKGYAAQQDRYLTFGGIGEGNIRPPASEALAIAASLSTGAYDADAAGVPAHEARARAVRLVASLAHRHAATSPGGWGDEWQSALWAYYAGFAGWMLWEDLPPGDRDAVERMLVYEADRFVDYEVPYYRDEAGTVVFPGDSKAEENAWNANLLQLATAMLPDHPRQRLWMDKNLELMISAFSRPADLDSEREVNGKRLAVCLNGSNIADDGTLVNHGFIHPDYMATTLHNNNAVLAYGLAGKATPEAALFNTGLVYRALVDLPFASPPFLAPGGTIYLDGSGDLYYPQGNDWGTSRRMHVALLDIQARALGLDEGATTPAAAWERLHAQRVLDMQARFADGRTYGATSEDTYSGREEWVAVHAAQAWLTKWLDHQPNAIRVTGRAYPVPPRDQAPATLTLEAPGELEAGRTERVVTTLHNRAQPVLSRVEMRLALPDGWTAEATSPSSFNSVGEGEEVTTTWNVTAGAGAGLTDITAQARYHAVGRWETVERTARVWFEPQNRVPRAQMTATASDAQSPHVASRAIDGDLTTLWHSQYRPHVPLPHSTTLALGGAYDVTALYYQPRLDHPNGVITSYKVYASADGATFTEVAAGDWALDHTTKTVSFSAHGARYIRLEALAGAGDYASAAELVVVGDPVPG
jgi:hypothetical protein